MGLGSDPSLRSSEGMLPNIEKALKNNKYLRISHLPVKIKEKASKKSLTRKKTRAIWSSSSFLDVCRIFPRSVSKTKCLVRLIAIVPEEASRTPPLPRSPGFCFGPGSHGGVLRDVRKAPTPYYFLKKGTGGASAFFFFGLWTSFFGDSREGCSDSHSVLPLSSQHWSSCRLDGKNTHKN